MSLRKGKKISGGKYIMRRKKKKYEVTGQKRTVKLGEEKRKTERIRGGNEKTVLLKSNVINVMTDNKKSKKVQIKNVLETPSNRFLARQNILIKGAIVQTELGKVRITNRPTQEGIINGVMVE